MTLRRVVDRIEELDGRIIRYELECGHDIRLPVRWPTSGRRLYCERCADAKA